MDSWGLKHARANNSQPIWSASDSISLDAGIVKTPFINKSLNQLTQLWYTKLWTKPYRSVVSAIAHLNAGLIDEIIRETTPWLIHLHFTNRHDRTENEYFPLGNINALGGKLSF